MNRFHYRLLIGHIIAGVLSLFLFLGLASFLAISHSFKLDALIILLFMGLGVCFQWILMQKAGGRAQSFIPTYMAASGLRLMFFLVALLLLVFKFRQSAVPIAMLFLICYFVFTAWEIVHMLQFLKQIEQKEAEKKDFG